jgi:amino acid adenylation domain-containing protein
MLGGNTMYNGSHEFEEFPPKMQASDTLVAIPEEYRHHFPLLTENVQRLGIGSITQQDYPRDICVPQLVGTQAATRPNAMALVVGDQALSYRELNRRANQLAHYLQKLGVGPNVLVGLCVERSFEMVVGLLGILKAGGTYVPLDPDYPPERLNFMLEDAQPPVLVTRQRQTSRLVVPQTSIVCLDADAGLLAQQREDEPDCPVTPSDLVYVVYTSGSTGRPKGVQITHGSLLNLIYWHQHAFAVTDSDRATQLTSPAFDATSWELWPYLTTGASVYLLDEEARAVPVACRDWLLRYGITITFLPTALAESVIALEWPTTTALRFLLTGADALRRYPSPSLPFKLINNYGPTEATVLVTSGQVLPTEQADRPPSIGRPIANTQIHILDKHLQQVPIGVPGELYIGGASLARGYLNHPELTAEKFISHPFSDEPGARLYRTGDLARYLPDGQIDFIGRTDHQVKIRGYRIEPGEIVSVLNEHPAVQASQVIAREDTPGDKRLVAYVVLVAGTRVTTSALRDILTKRLPDYMIPAMFVQLQALPLTPNGKVDHAALPAPDATNTISDVDIAAPGTLVEKRLYEIVLPLLSVEQVGIDDNFFLLGGTSLMGAQVIEKVTESLGVSLPLRILFEHPTIRQLANEIEQRLLARLDKMSDDKILRLLQEGMNA